VLVARQAADLDLLSGGRLRLGVGIGWNHVEYEALGQRYRTRGARQEEQIGLLRQLFTEPVVDFSGRFDRIDRAALVPRPAHTIPIWLGGSSEPAYDRAAGPGDLTAEIDGWRQAGGTHLSVVTMGLGLDSIDGHVDYLASVASALSLS
jgi:alkanesulfonate monooxygenase SsuD/methylene tetrahydromethanopterin reductase-like flavin-dependent oxidoreductase (luciferase family)